MENNLNLYYIFYTVANHKNISGAAKELYISQPAISKAISKLESNLSTKLFVRSSRGVNLTAEGEILYSQVRTAFISIQNGEKQLQKANELGIAQLSIGVSITLCKYILLPYLKCFVKDNPHIKVTITCHPSLETIKDIEKGVTDIGLVGISEPSSNLIYTPVMEIQDTFVTTKRYLDNFKIREGYDEKNKPNLLGNATFMMLNKENVSRKYVDAYLMSNQISMENIIEINTMDLLIELAKIDLGIACVIRDFVKDDIANGTLTELTFRRNIPKRRVGLVYRADAHMSDAMQKFISYFENCSVDV
jgi:DNA-binding transcriptional LysR family regulator